MFNSESQSAADVLVLISHAEAVLTHFADALIQGVHAFPQNQSDSCDVVP